MEYKKAIITTVEKAFNRIRFRFTGEKFTPNAIDMEAFNFLIDREDEINNYFNSNGDLTKKLFIYMFENELNRFCGDPDFAQKSMKRFVDAPLGYYETNFSKTYDNFQVNNFLDANEVDKYEDLTREKQEEFNEIFMTPERSEKVLKALRNTTKEFLIRYSNQYLKAI
jgi:hypothetical protein